MANVLTLSTHAATVSFTWNPNPEADLAGYKLYYGPASRSYTNHIVLGKVTTHTISTLVNGATYFFALTAFNSNNVESTLSGELRYPNAPALGVITDRAIAEDTVASIPLHVTDVDGPAAALTLSAVSSNLALVPANNISFSGTGTNRTMVITPAPNRTGSAGITVTVSDGVLASSRSFVLTVTGMPDPPSISSIADATTDEEVAIVVAYTVSDPETAASNLIVRAASSNPALIPTNRIVLNGTNETRTARLRPLANQHGSATITLTVIDASALSDSTTFNFTVLPVNDPPTISQITNLTLLEDTLSNPIAFTVGDEDSPLGGLLVSAASSNPGVVPPENILLSGSGSNRTVQVRPATNAVGSASINLTVSDGQTNTSSSFTINYSAVNDAPVVSNPPDLTVNRFSAVPPIPFTVWDAETPADQLVITLASTNITLLPTNNMALSGSGTNRTLTLTPLANQTGVTRVRIMVQDGTTNTRVFFLLTVTGGNNLESWRANYFTAADLQDPGKETTVWGDLADPDSDGRHNLMEFALGLNPLGSEPQESAFVSQIVNSGGGQYLTLTFKARINEPLLQYIPEVSADNAIWAATAQRVANTPINAEFEQVTYQDSVSITSEAARFIRLRVVKNSP